MCSAARLPKLHQSQGGLLLDSTGDIAFTASPWECLRSMANSRIKAALDGWQSYQMSRPE